MGECMRLRPPLSDLHPAVLKGRGIGGPSAQGQCVSCAGQQWGVGLNPGQALRPCSGPPLKQCLIDHLLSLHPLFASLHHCPVLIMP